MKQDALTSRRRWQIRRIFLLRRETYSTTEARRLLDIPTKELEARIARHEIDAEEGGRLTWKTVAHLAVQKWGIAGIEDGLGSDAPRVMPPLLRLEPVAVELPAYLVRYLYLRAEEQNVSIDVALSWELHDAFPVHELERYEAQIGGLRDALFFPE